MFGMIERSERTKKSRVRRFVVPNHKASVLLRKITQTCKSVRWFIPRRCAPTAIAPEYVNAFVDHLVRYVEGRVHTNRIKNFGAAWSVRSRHLYRSASVRPSRYLDEQMFRFNTGETDDADRFVTVAKNTDGHRVT